MKGFTFIILIAFGFTNAFGQASPIPPTPPPLPLGQKPAVTFCAGNTTSPISLGGLVWTNSDSTIGLAASGTGNIPSFVAVNHTAHPVRAIITAVRTSIGDSMVFPIIINPLATVDSVADISVCVGGNIPSVVFSGVQPNTLFTWSNSNTAIGLAASGQDSVPHFTATNSGSTPITATITITPTTSGYAYMTDAINGYAYAVSRATHAITNISGLTGFFGFSVGITTSADGSLVYIANNGDNSVSFINGVTQALTDTITVGSGPYGIVISPDQKTVYVTNSGDGTVSVISTSTNTVNATIALPRGAASNPEGIAISPDGTSLYVVASLANPANSKVYFINTATRAIIDSVTVGVDASGIVVSPSGGTLYVANYTGRTISAVNVATRTVTTSTPYTGIVNSQVQAVGLALSPTGDTLYAGSFWSGTVVTYKTTTAPPVFIDSIIMPTGTGAAPVGVSVSADGLYAYASNCGNGGYPGNHSALDVINAANHTVLRADTLNNPNGEEVSYSFGNFVTGISCSGTSRTFTITVNPVGAPQVSLAITAGSQSVCPGTSVTFKAIPVNGGTAPNYNFKVDGISVQNSTADTYTTAALSAGHTVTCQLTSNSPCANPDTITSAGINMTSGAAIPVSVTTSICQGASYAGHNSTGTFVDTIHSAGTCDTVRTLQLTVTPYTRDTVNKSICLGQSFDHYSIAGEYSDTFNGSNTCDSIRTLFLTVVQPVYDTINQTICAGESFEGHSTTGAFMDSFVSGAGCDSFRLLNLTVLAPPVVVIKQRICQGDTYQGHSMAGVYTDTLHFAGTCDSIFSLELTVDDIPSKPSITQSNDTLMASAAISYQWFLNDTAIHNATDSLLVIIRTGNYRVVVTDTSALCSNSSDEYPVTTLGISAPETMRLQLFPNPACASINLITSGRMDSYIVHDMLGKPIVRKEQIMSTQTVIDLQGWAQGIYILEATVGQCHIVKRFAVVE